MGNRSVRSARHARRAGAVAAAAVTAAIVLGACGGSDHTVAADPMAGMDHSSGSMEGMDDGTGTVASIPDDAEFNAADVAFAQGMIPHHGQAVAMADLALGASQDPEVIALAEKIKAAQNPEIVMMSGWLEDWGYDVPDPMADMSSMEPGEMSGMMTDEEMTELEAATGPAFDRLFLAMMVRHHEGAIEMAQELLADGKAPAALEVGQAVITAQQAEIVAMNAMLEARPT